MKCLIIDEMHPGIVPGLEKLGFESVYSPEITREEILDLLPSCQGLIVRSKTEIDKELIARGTNLMFIARAGAGIEQVDINYLKKCGIPLINAPEGNRDALAEHTVGLLLALSQNIIRGDREVRSGIWHREANRGTEIKGKTVGIIGYGFMGSAFAHRLSAFGCRVIAHDKYKRGFSNEFVEEASMDRIFSEAEILSLHVPQTDETVNFFDKKYFDKFRKKIVLINTSRGGILNLSDLADLLDQGQIRGAALDVLANEKIRSWNQTEKAIFDRLAAHSNVIFTPHVAGWTFESYERINRVILSKIKGIIRNN